MERKFQSIVLNEMQQKGKERTQGGQKRQVDVKRAGEAGRGYEGRGHRAYKSRRL
jgi:hypothetical protein